jgi:hypothetical protein
LCRLASSPVSTGRHRSSGMTPISNAAPFINSQLTDIVGLRASGIFPSGREPTVRTLREWTKLRRIPYHKIGRLVYFDPAEVSNHIRTKLKIPARG